MRGRRGSVRWLNDEVEARRQGLRLVNDRGSLRIVEQRKEHHLTSDKYNEGVVMMVGAGYVVNEEALKMKSREVDRASFEGSLLVMDDGWSTVDVHVDRSEPLHPHVPSSRVLAFLSYLREAGNSLLL